jgi:hypothetical protein
MKASTTAKKCKPPFQPSTKAIEFRSSVIRHQHEDWSGILKHNCILPKLVPTFDAVSTNSMYLRSTVRHDPYQAMSTADAMCVSAFHVHPQAPGVVPSFSFLVSVRNIVWTEGRYKDFITHYYPSRGKRTVPT